MSAKDAFLATWTVTEMELWDREAFELLGPAYFSFDESGFGQFRFIVVEGFMDCRFGERDGRPLVEFSWLGQDENDPASGRGWAVVDGETLEGRIFLHQGDDSSFKAVRDPDSTRVRRRRSRR